MRETAIISRSLSSVRPVKLNTVASRRETLDSYRPDALKTNLKKGLGREDQVWWRTLLMSVSRDALIYLAVLMDVFTRMIKAVAAQPHLNLFISDAQTA